MHRNTKILIFLSVLLAIALTWRVLNPYRQPTVDHLTYSDASAPDGASKNMKQIVAPGINSGVSDTGRGMYIDLFVNPPRHDDRVIRNIFSAEKTAPAPEPPDVAGDLAKAPQVQETPPVSPADRDRQALDNFRVFGFFQKGDERIFFLERGKDVLSVREGDLVDGKFVIESATDDKLFFRSRETGVRTALDIN